MIRKILFVLILAACHSTPSHATETCTPAQLTDSRILDTDHGAMCFELARTIAPLVQLVARCNSVVGIIADPARRQYFVTCRVIDLRQRADHAIVFMNYASVDGAPFEPVP